MKTTRKKCVQYVPYYSTVKPAYKVAAYKGNPAIKLLCPSPNMALGSKL